jgi:hypothetical protein
MHLLPTTSSSHDFRGENRFLRFLHTANERNYLSSFCRKESRIITLSDRDADEASKDRPLSQSEGS